MKHEKRIPLIAMQDALIRSGYLLEYRLASLLEEIGYQVDINCCYPDPLSDKTREFDLMASQEHELSRRTVDRISHHLLIECINNSQPLVVFPREESSYTIPYPKLVIRGLPLYVKALNTDLKFESIQSVLDIANCHYCAGTIATQWCTFQPKKNKAEEWMALHDDSQFTDIVKLCDAIDYFSGGNETYWGSNDEFVDCDIFYPILVLQGELYEAIATKRGVRLKKVPHVQFFRAVASKDRVSTYQIDIVTEKNFQKLLEILELEVLKLGEGLGLHRKRILEGNSRKFKRYFERTNASKSEHPGMSRWEITELMRKASIK